MVTSKIIRDLISVMSEDERLTLRNYLKAFDHRLQKQDSKMIRLLDLFLSEIKDGNRISESELERQIYGGVSNSAFSKLISRLKERILETLLIDINVNREGVYSDRSKIEIQLRKTISQAKILQNRGLRDLSAQLFQNVIEIALKNEFYEEGMIALRLLINHLFLSKGEQATTKYIKMYENAEYAVSAMFNSELIYTKYGVQGEFNSGTVIKAVEIQDALNQLRKFYIKTKSSIIGYRYFLLETQYYQSINEYKKARKSITNIIQLLDVRPTIYTPDRIGIALLNQVENDIFLLNINRAGETLKHSQKYFNKRSYNYGISLELSFYIHFYNNSFLQANNVIEDLVNSKIENFDFKNGKQAFLLANAKFALGEVQKSLEIISVINPIEDDRKGWNIGIRLLNIICLCELERYDELERRVETLRKYIDKYKLHSSRLNLIIELLKSFLKTNFNYKKTFQINLDLFNKMNSNHADFRWKILSFELINISQWFYYKSIKQNYNLDLHYYKQDKLLN